MIRFCKRLLRLLLIFSTSLLLMSVNYGTASAQQNGNGLLSFTLPHFSKDDSQDNSQSNSQQDSTPTAPVQTRLWNFEDADIRTVIEEVAKETHKNFLIDPRVQGKVTLVSSQPIDVNELYRLFLTVLQTSGYAAVPSGDVIKIVPDTLARFEALPMIINPNVMPAKNAQMTVKIIPVQNLNASQLVPILRPILPPASDVAVNNQTNALILSAPSNKIAEIETLVRQLDQPNSSSIEIVPLTFASAKDITSTLKSLIPPNSYGQTPLLIAADADSNSILISGTPQDRDRIKLLVHRMDNLAGTSGSSNTTAVVYLKYLNAKDFVNILRSIVSGVPAPATGPSTPPNPVAGAGGTGLESSQTGSDNGSTDQSNSSYQVPGMPNFNNSMAGAAYGSDSGGSVGGSLSTMNGKNVTIDAEPDTNAIIITGPPAEILSLKSIIARLDTKPQQVLVAAVIAEVSDTTLQQLGFEWGTLPKGGTGAITSFSGTLSDNGTGAFSTLAGGLGVGIIDAGRFKQIIHLLESDQTTNILSTPSVVVLDNQKAKIKVGQKVSFVTGQYASTNQTTTVTPFTTTDREDVALTLNVIPQISPGGIIRLALSQGNQTLSGNIINGNPTTNESDIDTSVLIHSGQILVVGGLVSNDLEATLQKVPFLGDIPVLGWFFQYHNNNLARKNLLVFLQPIIMDDEATANCQTGKNYNYIRTLELQRQQTADPILPPCANRVLPQWQPLQLPKPFTNTN